jgi:hypothetical protein
MSRIILCGIVLFLFVTFSAAADEVNIGDIVFRESFDGGRFPDGWTVTNPEHIFVSENTVRVNLPADGKDKFASASKTLSHNNLLGTRLKVTAKIKAENIAAVPNVWNGVKVMLVIDTPDGKRWFQKNCKTGTFDWTTIRFDAAVPIETTSAVLVLGLENTTGQVQIDDVEITVIGKRRSSANQSNTENKPVYKGHHLPRLRGAMVSPGNRRFGPKDIKVFGGEWKANLVRWQFTWSGFPNGPADTATVEQYNDWIETQCKILDAMLPECEKYGVHVCLDLHTPPGGRLPRDDGSVMRLFQEQKFQDAFVAVWEKLAKRYKNAKMVWSYDLLNEPVEGDIRDDGSILNWHALALKTAKAIRKIDPDKAIVLEAAPWGNPETLDWFEPFDPKEVPNIVYSVHVYVPHSFTHQCVHESTAVLNYPGEIDGKYWDKNTLRKALQIPVEYAKDYGVAIYIGEFSAVRWAPDGSAYRYLKDCIELFEEQGWDWSYHAFREFDGWSVEHGSDKNDHKPAAEPTDRERLLRSWFQLNQYTK